MKLFLHYDPWKERGEAQRAADAFSTLGMPVELVEERCSPRRNAVPASGPVKFEATAKACTNCGDAPCRCREIAAQ